MSKGFFTSLVGGLLGFALGAPFGAGALGFRIGFTVGSIAANYLFPVQGPNTEGPRLTDLTTMTAHEGAPMPIIYGSVRIPGVVIWTTGIKETSSESGGGGGKGSPGGGGGTQTTYTYSATFAVAFCEGPISGIRRMWADTKLFYDGRDTQTIDFIFFGQRSGEAILAATQQVNHLEFYTGTETQDPDPLIQSVEGVGNTPAFRNVVYVVFNDLQLKNYGNRIPSFSAEVVKGNVIDPPIRVAEFDPQININKLEYTNGIFTVPSYQGGVPDSKHGKSILKTYNLEGQLLDQDSYVGKNLNNATNVNNTLIGGIGRILFQKQNAAGDGFPGVAVWWLWDLGGGSGISIPVGPRPKRSSGEGLDVFSYYNAVANTRNAPIWFEDNIYAENIGAANQWGIARYYAEFIPSTIPDHFVEFNDSFGGDVPALNIAHGGNGRIYIWRAVQGTFDDGTELREYDTRLNLLRAFKVDQPFPNNAGLWVYDDLLVHSNSNTVHLLDISPAALAANGNSAPLIGSTPHLADLGGPTARDLKGLEGCLFVKNDGLYSMCQQIELDAPTLRSIVEDICIRCGLLIGQVDAIDLTPIVDGYVIAQPMQGRSAIEGLQPAFNFDGFESDAKVKFLLRGGTSQVTIPVDDLGAFSSKPPISELVRTRQQELELPAEVDMLYMDLNQDYELGGVRARRIITTSINEVAIQLPVVMSSEKAAQAADIYLQTVWTERVSYSFALTQKYNYLDPADLITLPIATGNILVRLTSVTKGKNNIIEFDAVEDASILYSSVEVGNDPNLEDEQFIGIKGPTKLQVLDIALLRDSDDTPGFYLSAAGYYPDWSGAAITRIDDGESEVLVGAIFNAATCGITTDELADPPPLNRGRDVISKVNVNVINGSLASVSDTNFLNGVNVAIIGQELLLFRDVTFEADGSYTLRHFIRGLQGTTATDHEDGSERFVLLTESTVKSFGGSLSDSGVNAQFNSTSFGDLGATPIRTFVTLQNGRLKPNPPAHANASLNPVDNSFAGQWVRSARVSVEWIDSINGAALDETTEVYEVDVLAMDATDEIPATILRTITGIGSEASFVYSAADQITDFGSVQTDIDFEVFQISNRVGRGKVSAFTGTTPSFPIEAYDASVLADGALMYVLFNLRNGKNGFYTLGKWSNGANGGTEGVNYDYNGVSPFADEIASGIGIWRHLTGITRFETPNDATSENLNQMLKSWAVEFLLKTNMATSGNLVYIVGRVVANNLGNGQSLWSGTLPVNDRDNLGFYYHPEGAGVENLVTTGESLNDGSWHHIVMVYDNALGASGKTFIYVDGTESTSQTIAAGADIAVRTDSGPNAQKARVFEHTQTANDVMFEGEFCRAAYYAVVLTPAQVAQHYTDTGL